MLLGTRVLRPGDVVGGVISGRFASGGGGLYGLFRSGDSEYALLIEARRVGNKKKWVSASGEGKRSVFGFTMPSSPLHGSMPCDNSTNILQTDGYPHHDKGSNYLNMSPAELGACEQSFPPPRH